MTIENYSLYNSNKYLHPVFTSEKVEAGILTKPIETIQKTIETGFDTFVGQENDQKKKKTRRFSTSSFRSSVQACLATPNIFSLANLHFVLQTMLGNKSPPQSSPTRGGSRKFRAYCSEQSMLVRQ